MQVRAANSNKHPDVAVIGAGVFGVWIAHQLIGEGKSVVLLDAYGAANSRASSGGESRIIRVGYGADEFYSRWAMQSLQRWRDFATSVDPTLFHPSGVLWMSSNGDPHGLHSLRTLEKLGISFEILSKNFLQERYPQINFSDIETGILEIESGVVAARRAVQSLFRAGIQKGLDYRAEVVQPPAAEGNLSEIRTTSGKTLSAGVFVFACGSWMPKVFPTLLRDRIVSTRQEVYFFGTPPGDPRFSVSTMPAWIDFGNETYGVPDLENRGFKIAFDRHGPVFDPDLSERIVTADLLAATRQHLAHRFPALKNAPLLEGRVCQYENTSNGDFLIDRHPEFRNVWLVCGGSGHGFKHGPMVGEYVAGRINDDGPVEPRFTLETKAKSRQRTVF